MAEHRYVALQSKLLGAHRHVYLRLGPRPESRPIVLSGVLDEDDYTTLVDVFLAAQGCEAIVSFVETDGESGDPLPDQVDAILAGIRRGLIGALDDFLTAHPDANRSAIVINHDDSGAGWNITEGF